jgi:hypothetical protein
MGVKPLVVICAVLSVLAALTFSFALKAPQAPQAMATQQSEPAG